MISSHHIKNGTADSFKRFRVERGGEVGWAAAYFSAFFLACSSLMASSIAASSSYTSSFSS